MLFGDDALYYQIIHDAHDRDPAIAWRYRPFTRSAARTAIRNPQAVDPGPVIDRLGAGVRAMMQRLRPQSLSGDLCCAPACC